MRSRLVLVATAIIAVALALAACAPPSGQSQGGSTSSGGKTITLQNIAFNPPTLTVKAGDTVTFKNADNVPHHIVVGTDDLGQQAQGESKTWKAPKDGVYMMKCVIHPSMQGQITVGAGGPTVGTPSTGTSGTGGSTGGSGTVPGY